VILREGILPSLFFPQSTSDPHVASFSTVGTNYKSFLTPGKANFDKPQNVFASNARTIALVAKFTF
jgi:hypothetical protein